MNTTRLTVAQAVVRFLSVQWTERDGVEARTIPACLGIFGHGNVAGLGQALLESAAAAGPGQDAALPYVLARNEQAMVHTAVGYARTRNRMQTLACTSSVGPGATNMVTGAALATINRLPVLLLPGDVFATRAAGTVLQELEVFGDPGISVNDAFRPVSRFFDRVYRPEQLPSALLGAMRVLTDPARTGAVTLALPQDVQAEAYDWPDELFARRVWHVGRHRPGSGALDRAVTVLRSAKRPLVVAGGGVVYSAACEALADFADVHGIPVADTHAAKGALPFDHPCAAGGLGVTGSPVANGLARDADVVLGIGTRYTDFTTGSRTVFGDPGLRFVNLNIASFDAAKHGATMLVADARAGLEALTSALGDYRAPAEWVARHRDLAGPWAAEVHRALHLGHSPLPAQTEVIGAVNDLLGPRDVVVAAAGSLPGQLQMLWRARDPKTYHVEYGFSCMGYEIAGALGVKMAAPDRQVVALVGDGSYLMMAQEIVTAIAENLKLVIVLVQNHGFASIGALSESVGAERFGTAYRRRDPASGRLDGGLLPVDLAANAASLGADVLRATTIGEFRKALSAALAAEATTVVYVETDPLAPVPSSDCWWDVPVAEVADLASTQEARARYTDAKRAQRSYLR